MMRAIGLVEFGDIDSMKFNDYPMPIYGEEEVLIKVGAIGLNRADILQRKGFYPAPKGASQLLGLEVSGIVVEIGQSVHGIKVGDRVAGLLSGGAYAEYASCHFEHTLSIPDGMSFEDAAAIPEVFITAFQALCAIGDLHHGQTVLIHAAASGVGTAAIQIAKNLGAVVIATASAAKHAACRSLGADFCIDYKKENFDAKVAEFTQGVGVDLIIDFVGADYFQKNIKSTKLDGKIVMLGFLSGVKTPEINLANILRNRIQITGTTLRSRSINYKTNLISNFKKNIFPEILTKKIYPVIHKILDWEEFKKAHQMMESNENVGKIILKIKG